MEATAYFCPAESKIHFKMCWFPWYLQADSSSDNLFVVGNELSQYVQYI